MRKAIGFLLILLIVVSSGCSSTSEEAKDLKLADILQKFKDAGLEMKDLDKPVPETVGAIDGFIFYDNLKAVKVYEYKSAKALKQAEDIFPQSKDYPKLGRFLLVSDDEKAIEVFKTIQP
jgi:ABC-type Fe3+-hydroxamate transport system substrate-binding protein